MTLKLLSKTHKEYLAEFDRAVKRRRRDLTRFFAYQIKQRKKMPDPNNSSRPAAVKLKKTMTEYLHRSIFNSVSKPKCARWHRYKNGFWSASKKGRCPA